MYAAAFYQNSAMPSGLIKTGEDYDEEEAKAWKKEWQQLNGGIGQSQGVAILTGGAEFQQISLSPEQAQFLQSRQYGAATISGQIFRVPPHMIGIVDRTTSWGTGIEQQELGFVRNTLLIWLCRWEDLMTSWLPARQFVTFDLSQRLRGDTLQRFQAYQIARICGFMNNLDVIRAEGLTVPTDPELLSQLGDYSAPLNSSPMKVSGPNGPGGDKAN
jgi:HK97 family phage portal protein